MKCNSNEYVLIHLIKMGKSIGLFGLISDKVDKKDKKKEEPGSFFQRQRVDLLLGELAKKFPPKFVAPTQPGPEVKGTCIISSQGELIVYQSSRRPSVRPSVCASVNTFKHEYLHNQWANRNQILSKASLG